MHKSDLDALCRIPQQPGVVFHHCLTPSEKRDFCRRRQSLRRQDKRIGQVGHRIADLHLIHLPGNSICARPDLHAGRSILPGRT